MIPITGIWVYILRKSSTERAKEMKIEVPLKRRIPRRTKSMRLVKSITSPPFSAQQQLNPYPLKDYFLLGHPLTEKGN
jgi:hypothetical protein